MPNNTKTITKGWLVEQYVQNKLSMLLIAKLFGCSVNKVNFCMKKYNIPKRTSREGLLCSKIGPTSDKFKKNLSAQRKGNKNPFYGKTHTLEWKRSVSEKVGGKNHFNWGKSGKGTTGWKPVHLRQTPLYLQIRTCRFYKQWRGRVYERDNYTCQICGDSSGGNLNADHIVPFASIVSNNKIDTLEKACRCLELWDVGNGRTLCVRCHENTPTYRRGKFK